jgi:hypothetical protein
MSEDKLFSYIAEDRSHAGITAFKRWLDNSDNFCHFVSANSDKIRGKIRGAKSDEDLIDVVFELEVAFNMVCMDGYEVEYEKYGCQIGRAPDFTVSSRSGLVFNVEVKRIREGALGAKYQAMTDDIVAQIRPIPSMLAFSFAIDDMDLDQGFLNRFEAATITLIDFIKDKIRLEDQRLPFDETVDYELPGFEDEISIILSKPKGKLDNSKTSYHGGSFPIFYTQKESNKFGDAIFEKVGQMIPGSINIMVIASNSSTHEKEDLQDAILSIRELVRDKNESFFVKKGFRDINDFLSQAENLSGVLFKTTWSSLSNPENYLWCNQNALLKIPDEIRPFLTGLGKK